MTIQLLSVLSAAALAATSVGNAPETRSAQSLPVQNLALAQLPARSAGKAQVRHLADATAEPSDESNCKRDGGHWNDKVLKCGKAAWWAGSGAQVLIGLGTATGLVYALSGSSNNYTGSSNPVSN